MNGKKKKKNVMLPFTIKLLSNKLLKIFDITNKNQLDNCVNISSFLILEEK